MNKGVITFFKILSIIWLLYGGFCLLIPDDPEPINTSIIDDPFSGVRVDTSKIAIISNAEDNLLQFADHWDAYLDQNELKKLEVLLLFSIIKINANTSDSLRNSGVSFYDHFTKNQYYRQYVVSENEQGEKFVWVNFFCDTSLLNFTAGEDTIDWKKDIIEVDDGGNCFANVMVNLSKNKVFDLTINGVR